MPTPAEKYEIAAALKQSIDELKAKRKVLAADIKAKENDLAAVLRDDGQMDLEGAE